MPADWPAQLEAIAAAHPRAADADAAHAAAAAAMRCYPLDVRFEMRRWWFRKHHRLQRFGHRWEDPVSDEAVFGDIPLETLAREAVERIGRDDVHGIQLLRHVVAAGPWPLAAATACAAAQVARGDLCWSPLYHLEQRMRRDGMLDEARAAGRVLRIPHDDHAAAWRNLLDAAQWARPELPEAARRLRRVVEDGTAPGRPAPVEIIQDWLAEGDGGAARQRVLDAMDGPTPRDWFETWNRLARRRKGLEEIPYDRLLRGARRAELALDLLHDEPKAAVPGVEALGRAMEAPDWPVLEEQVMYLLRRAGKPTVRAILDHLLPRLGSVAPAAHDAVAQRLAASAAKRDQQAAAVLRGASLDKVRPPPRTDAPPRSRTPPWSDAHGVWPGNAQPAQEPLWLADERSRAARLELDGHGRDAARLIRDALQRCEGEESTPGLEVGRARLEAQLASLRSRRGDLRGGLDLAEAAMHRLADVPGREGRWASAAVEVGAAYTTLLMETHRLDEARAVAEETVEVARRHFLASQEATPLVDALGHLASVASGRGDQHAALSCAEEAAALADGMPLRQASLALVASLAAQHAGDLDRAGRHIHRAVGLYQELAEEGTPGIHYPLAHALDRAAAVAMERHDWASAASLLARSGPIHHELAERDPYDRDLMQVRLDHLRIVHDLACIQGRGRAARQARRGIRGVERALRGGTAPRRAGGPDGRRRRSHE